MSPPTYSDLGKDARGIFSKGYHFGSVQLNANTTTESGITVSTGGDHSIETGKVAGNLETKYKCKDYGLNITEKWTTDNILKADVSIEDKLTKGLKLALNTNFSPVTGKKKGTLSGTYKTALVSVNADSNLLMCPVLNGALVAGHKNFLFGFQTQYDTAKNKTTKVNCAFGFTGKDFTLHSFVNDGTDYGGSLHHKLSKDLEAAVNVGMNINGNSTHFALGCKYALDRNSILRAKVDNKAIIGLGFQHKLRDGVTLSLSSQVDAKNLNSGGHKLGLALDLDA